MIDGPRLSVADVHTRHVCATQLHDVRESKSRFLEAVNYIQLELVRCNIAILVSPASNVVINKRYLQCLTATLLHPVSRKKPGSKTCKIIRVMRSCSEFEA